MVLHQPTASGQRREPQLRGVLLHGRHLIHARVLHGGLDKVRIGRAGPRHIRLRLQVLIQGVPHVDESLHLLVPVTDLRGLGLIQVVGVRSYGIRDIRQEIQHAPGTAAARDTGVRRGIPPAEDDAHGQRPEELHHVERLVLDHHLVGHARRHDDREERGEGHAHLEDPPERALRPGEGRVREELVRLEDDLVDLFLQQVHTEV